MANSPEALVNVVTYQASGPTGVKSPHNELEALGALVSSEKSPSETYPWPSYWYHLFNTIQMT